MDANHKLRLVAAATANELDRLADCLQSWAQQSIAGGWSTHQVAENRKQADACLRVAMKLRKAIEEARRAQA